jgi:lysozyme
MVSLTFNVGMQGFLGSSVRRLHNAGEFPAAAGAFLLWDKAHVDGQLVTLPGLLNRRRAEEALYLTGLQLAPQRRMVSL